MSELPTFEVQGRPLGGGRPFLIAGPCVLESRELTLRIAERLSEMTRDLEVDLIFKASFDKANRTSLSTGRGPGIEGGLGWLGEVRRDLGLPTLTDVHLPEQCAPAAECVDVLQIPAFLCRQTDLLVAASQTGCAVNVKKGQFLAPWDMQHVTDKLRGAGCEQIAVTERGSTFGYGRLVVDMTGLRDLSATGAPLIIDATHAVQRPGEGGRTGGDRTLAPLVARSAFATGLVDGLFCEVHPDPDSSPSDGPNMIQLEDFPEVLRGCLAIHRAAGAGCRAAGA